MGDPNLDLKRNLRRLAYVMEKFGITNRDLGVTGHGLRHEVFNDGYEDLTGEPSPVRGGGPVDPELDARARLAVARLAGHARPRAAGAYLGPSIAKRNKAQRSATWCRARWVGLDIDLRCRSSQRVSERSRAQPVLFCRHEASLATVRRRPPS